MERIRSDLQELKADIKVLIVQGAVHNELLKTHEARSLALQRAQEVQAKAMEPVERHVAFVNGLGKAALAIIVGALIKLASSFF